MQTGKGVNIQAETLDLMEKGSGHSCLKQESYKLYEVFSNSFFLTFYLQVMQPLKVEFFYILSLNQNIKW